MATRSKTPTIRAGSSTKAKDQPSFVSAPAARTTRATATRTQASKLESAPQPAPKSKQPVAKANARKPLLNRQNSPEPAQQVPKPMKATLKKAVTANIEDTDKEPIKAYLRIRPKLGDDEPSSRPYLQSLSSISVQMTDPTTSRIRLNQNTQSIYTFTHVFPPDTVQADFFSKTTLPLVHDLLAGQNGLIFTYGVTNSGKTYTIQGGSDRNSAGLLPRTLDVVFNSLDGLHSNAPYRPIRLGGVGYEDANSAQNSEFKFPDTTDESVISEVFAEHARGYTNPQESDTTTLKVDRNYEYSIWVSYSEVYNEKIFDLLSADASDEDTTPAPNSRPRTTSIKKLSHSTSTWHNLAALSHSSSTDVLLVKRTALALKNDPDGGKYVAGLREIRVRTAAEAKAVFRTGNINRRVFGTLANSASSRSHGIFTIKVLKVHKGAPDDIDSVTSSRLSIVDLAGSERTKNTHNTGERLKEAGSINKSLMVLGQCMEALRNNQRRQAASLATPGRGMLDNSRLGIVPFRHSKLTELFQDLFVGERDGRAVMIVNVNPYDTGFDENSHVMKFAALAREVKTTVAGPGNIATGLGTKRKVDNGATIPHRRHVTISTGGTGGKKKSEAHLEVIEEDEGTGDDNPNESINPLVDALFDEVEDLRIKLYESEMQCAIIEAETREEVMQEMEQRMMNMERMFARRLMDEVEQNEIKTDAKIDMLHQFGNFAAKAKAPNRKGNKTLPESNDENEENFEEEMANIDEADEDEPSDEESLPLASPSPTPVRNRASRSLGKNKALDDSPECIGLRDEEMAIDDLDADETMTIGEEDEDEDGEYGTEDDKDDDSATEGEDDNDEDEWNPYSADTSPEPALKTRTLRSLVPKSSPRIKATAKAKAQPPSSSSSISPVTGQDKSKKPPGRTQRSRGVSKIQEQFDLLSLHNHAENDPRSDSSLAEGVKKKRTLGKKAVLSDEQIEEAAVAEEQMIAKSKGAATSKRTRGNR